MKAKITFIKTGKTQEMEIAEIYYSAEKIVLIHANGGFTIFFHGDKVKIEITKN
jgi:hypothetical protein